MSPGVTILEAVVGSTAYNLAGSGSDIDVLGVHVANPNDLLTWGLSRTQETSVTHDPDHATHDVGKFLRLALGGNPTILELLWLPAYRVQTVEGVALVDLRSALLGAEALNNSYAGYAHQQFLRQRAGKVSEQRRAKHTRHCFRLLLQGSQLLTEGTMSVAVDDSTRSFLMQIGEAEPEDVYAEYVRQRDAFDAAYANTSLPPTPGRVATTDLLRQIRRSHLDSS